MELIPCHSRETCPRLEPPAALPNPAVALNSRRRENNIIQHSAFPLRVASTGKDARAECSFLSPSKPLAQRRRKWRGSKGAAPPLK